MPKKKWLREFTLNVAQGRNIQRGYRENMSLLTPQPRRVLEFNRGVPIFSRSVDTIQNIATGNRQYKPTQKKATVFTDFDETNLHEMKGKFEFHVDGQFAKGGSEFEGEIHEVASDLFLVGFIKARSRYAMGHLQGDVFALSHMRKWLENRFSETARIKNVHVFEDSYGIPEYRYTKLECIKDWRSPVRRRQHMSAIQEDGKISLLQERSNQRRLPHDLPILP